MSESQRAPLALQSMPRVRQDREAGSAHERHFREIDDDRVISIVGQLAEAASEMWSGRDVYFAPHLYDDIGPIAVACH